MRSLVALALLALLVAGCLDGARPGEDDDAPLDTGLPRPTGYTYMCPPGETEESHGLCVGQIRIPDAWLTEPFLVIDQARPDVVVIGAIRTEEESATRGLEEGSLRNPLRVTFFVSADGGATWERREHPDLPKRNGGHEHHSLDPALAFDAEGTLHVSLLVSTGEVYYTNTSDLGRTWTPPVHLSPSGGGDRNWMTVDAIGAFVPWYTAEGTHIAYTDPRRDAWTRATLDGCGIASQVVLRNGTPLVACTHLEEDAPIGIRIGDLDPAAATLSVRADVAASGADWPFLLSGPGPTLHLVAQSRDQTRIFYAASDDDGNTWTETSSLRGPLHVEDDWPRARPYWAAVDPWGHLHLILSEDGPGVENEAAFIYAKPAAGPTRPPVAHAVLDMETGEVLAERMLVDPSLRTTETPGAPVALFDHYYGLDFGTTHGLMVWADEGSLRYTRVEPVPAR